MAGADSVRNEQVPISRQKPDPEVRYKSSQETRLEQMIDLVVRPVIQSKMADNIGFSNILPVQGGRSMFSFPVSHRSL